MDASIFAPNNSGGVGAGRGGRGGRGGGRGRGGNPGQRGDRGGAGDRGRGTGQGRGAEPGRATDPGRGTDGGGRGRGQDARSDTTPRPVPNAPTSGQDSQYGANARGRRTEGRHRRPNGISDDVFERDARLIQMATELYNGKIGNDLGKAVHTNTRMAHHGSANKSIEIYLRMFQVEDGFYEASSHLGFPPGSEERRVYEGIVGQTTPSGPGGPDHENTDTPAEGTQPHPDVQAEVTGGQEPTDSTSETTPEQELGSQSASTERQLAPTEQPLAPGTPGEGGQEVVNPRGDVPAGPEQTSVERDLAEANQKLDDCNDERSTLSSDLETAQEEIRHLKDQLKRVAKFFLDPVGNRYSIHKDPDTTDPAGVEQSAQEVVEHFNSTAKALEDAEGDALPVIAESIEGGQYVVLDKDEDLSDGQYRGKFRNVALDVVIDAYNDLKKEQATQAATPQVSEPKCDLPEHDTLQSERDGARSDLRRFKSEPNCTIAEHQNLNDDLDAVTAELDLLRNDVDKGDCGFAPHAALQADLTTAQSETTSARASVADLKAEVERLTMVNADLARADPVRTARTESAAVPPAYQVAMQTLEGERDALQQQLDAVGTRDPTECLNEQHGTLQVERDQAVEQYTSLHAYTSNLQQDAWKLLTHLAVKPVE